MPTRTIKFFGRTFGPSGSSTTIICHMNGQKIHEGSVPNLYQQLLPVQENGDFWFEVETPWEWSGDIPFTMYIEGGTAVWCTLIGNYMGAKKVVVGLAPGATFPNGSFTTEEWEQDFASMTFEQMEAKYGAPTPASNYIWATLTESKDNWGDPCGTNTILSDGRDAVTIDGVPQFMNLELREQDCTGDWGWTIPSESTLECVLTLLAPVAD